MNRFADHMDRVIALCQKHEISCDGLEASRRRYAAFQVPVPVLGSYNTGKSSLLNALLGSRLLPTGIVTKTKIPTEITAGEENIVTAYHRDHSRRLGLGDLRDRGTDFTGVSRLHVSCNNPFLRQIDRIRLVDMPGLDSLDRTQEQALRDYLPQSLAYILVFSADEPVLKESVASFLNELRLREAPVVPVLTKSDKITPDELRRARAFLEKKLGELFVLDHISFCTVSARGDVEPVRRQLLLLQERADNLIERALTDKLRETATSLRAYLSLRWEIAALATSEAERQSEALSARIDAVRSLLEERIALFEAESQACGEQILQRARESIQAAGEPIETMLYAGNNPCEYIDSMLRAVIAAGLVNSFVPMWEGFIEQISMLLKIHGSSRESSFEFEAFAVQAGSDRSLEGEETLHISAESALQAFESSWSLFEDPPFRHARGAGRQEAIGRDMEERIIPGLYQRCEECVREVLRQSTAQLKDTLERILMLEAQLNQKALEDIARERAQQKSGVDDRRIEEDLRAVQESLEACSPAGGV